MLQVFTYLLYHSYFIMPIAHLTLVSVYSHAVCDRRKWGGEETTRVQTEEGASIGLGPPVERLVRQGEPWTGAGDMWDLTAPPQLYFWTTYHLTSSKEMQVLFELFGSYFNYNLNIWHYLKVKYNFTTKLIWIGY